MFGYRVLGFGVNDPITAAGIIESIQEIEFTIASGSATGTATISSVTTGNTALFVSYSSFGGKRQTNTDTTSNDVMVSVDLTNATTVTATRNTASLFIIDVVCTVVEYKAAAVDSIQQGTITVTGSNTSGTDTISSVTTSRSAVVFNGIHTTQSGSFSGNLFDVALTDATTVTATRVGTASSTSTIRYVVIEFASGITDSVQEFSITITSDVATTNTATISSVDTARSVIFPGGIKNSVTAIQVSNDICHVQLTNATTVTITRNTATADDPAVSGTVVEFASGKLDSVQRGVATIASGSASEDITVTSVVVAQSVVNSLCCTSTSESSIDPEEQHYSIAIIDSTTIRATRNVTGRDIIFSWELVEYA